MPKPDHQDFTSCQSGNQSRITETAIDSGTTTNANNGVDNSVKIGGMRGMEGYIPSAHYARKNSILPYFYY